MAVKLDGKVAIVTGAAGGIGAAYARHLAQLGATAVIADIDAEGASTTAKELVAEGLKASSGAVDISDPTSAAALTAAVVEEEGSVDILVNNAAIYRGLQLEVAEEIDLDYWRRMIDVNISGTYYMCRAVIPHMRRQQSGRIVNQSSIASWLGAPLALHYCTTKAAVVAMTKVLSRELGEDGITVNAIAPGLILTPATLETIPEMMQDMYLMNASIKRPGNPDDLLGALELLCTSDGNYITGQTLVVDGGIVTLG